jgi:hypothetical protein
MGLREKAKEKCLPKAKEKLFNMAIEEKRKLALLPRVTLGLPRTHPSHVGSATKLATPLTVVRDA